ncbi:MAG TPA: hypothetical protein VEJ43_03750 [Pseudolabrys sp.]|nr:hypothetical protein [Pseudolabrys sp.]
MVLAERAQALALTKFATMVRQDDMQKTEETVAKATPSDDLPDNPKAPVKAARKLRTADLLPQVIWGGN